MLDIFSQIGLFYDQLIMLKIFASNKCSQVFG